MTGTLSAAALAFLLAASIARADGVVRIATWDTGLSRSGPGLLLRDLGREPDPALAGVAAVIRAAHPDILLLTDIDDDRRGLALDAFRSLLRQGPDGIDYRFAFHAAVNAGEPSGLDLDGDGALAGRGDNHGWGDFPGQGGMALLSRLPIDTAAARSFRLLPWSALPGALLPERPDGTAFPDAATRPALRLSSHAHWDVPVVLPDGTRLHLLASNPTPPLFDGPEARNRRRNHDEIAFWSAYLAGAAFPDDTGRTAPLDAGPPVVLGNLNLDPADGRGLHEAIAGLLADPRLQDPRPSSPGARAAGSDGANRRQNGDPALDTADWRDDDGPGNLRTDYVLPAAELTVTAAGVVWPAPGDPLAAEAAAASPHRLVWVDIALP